MTVATELPEPRQAGWRNTPAWSVLAPVKRQGHAQELVLSVYREHGVIPKASRDDNHNRTPDNLDTYQLVEPGDVVFNKMKAWSGSVGVSGHRGIVSPDYMVCQVLSSGVDRRFLHYLLRSQALFSEYRRRSKGIRPSQWRLYFDELRSVELPLPGIETQRRVADMLDAETARIDTLIEKNERVLALLDARRLSLVSIRTSGAGSDEGSFVPLRYLARLDPGKSEVKHLPDDLDVDFIPMEAVGHGGRLHPTETRPIGEVRDGYTYLRSGDVTFAKISPSFQNRKGGRAEWLTNGLAFATTELTILRPEPTTDARFLQYVIESEPFIQHGAATLHGVAGQQRVDLSRVAAFPVWSPDIETQRHIADMLDAETAKMHALTSAVDRQQQLLRLRRQALITAAVTGHIGV